MKYKIPKHSKVALILYNQPPLYLLSTHDFILDPLATRLVIGPPTCFSNNLSRCLNRFFDTNWCTVIFTEHKFYHNTMVKMFCVQSTDLRLIEEPGHEI